MEELSAGSAAVPKVILVVEDNDAVREVAVELVESLGYRVVSAMNADEALLCMKSKRVDAVLTDVMMPGMSGFELAKRIRALDPDMPIICVTGYNQLAEDSRRYDALIQKPYRAATIAETLKSVLGT